MESKISAGSYELNTFLHGGYETDIITTLYGPGASGKSNLCVIVATSQARKGNKVIFIDTEGGFSTERFKQIHQGTKEEIETALQNQEKSFDQMLKHVKQESISLIIIDSIAMLYRLELGDAIQSNDSEQISKVNRKLAKQLRALNEITRKQNIPVIVTNQVYSAFNPSTLNPQPSTSIPERQVSMEKDITTKEN